jgi:hypothetical protein
MNLPSLLKQDELLIRGNAAEIWVKYCGFLDLTIDEFMVIQKALLIDQIEILANCEIGRQIFKGKKPANIDEFRRRVPFTCYGYYEPYFSQKKEEVTPVRPVIWAHTAGRTGLVKWAPYSLENFSRLADDTLSAFILSAARSKDKYQRKRKGNS